MERIVILFAIITSSWLAVDGCRPKEREKIDPQSSFQIESKPAAALESETRKNIGIAGMNVDFDSIKTPGETLTRYRPRLKLESHRVVGQSRDWPAGYFSPKLKQKFEDQLDEQIIYKDIERRSKDSRHENERKSGMDKLNAALLSMLKQGGERNSQSILRRLESSDLSSFEGTAELTEVPKTNKPKIFAWQGGCEKSRGDIQGFVVKSFTEEKTFIKQKIIPVKPDDPKACGEYSVLISELNTPEDDSYWVTVATLSTNNMESAPAELHIEKPKGPKELTIREVEE